MRTEVPVPPAVSATGFTLNEVVGPPVTTGETLAASETPPVKPRLLSVMVDVAELPATILEGVAAPAAMVKSGVTVMVTVAE